MDQTQAKPVDGSEPVSAVPLPGRKNGRTFNPSAVIDEAALGRPAMPYDRDVAIRFCEAIADGQGSQALCQTDQFPSWPTIRKWLASETDFALRYAQARTISAETLEYEAIEIADRPGLDPHDKRVRVDTRKWAAAKRNPRVYGDKIDLNVSGGLSIVASLDTSRLSLEELQVLESLLSKARKAEPLTIENNRLGDTESPHKDG